MTDRRVLDSKGLTAMAHPLRRRLLSLLDVYGPAMPSVLSERTGTAVGNISHHLRVLAAAGLIEEAPELARDRRERWWRRAPGAFSWSSHDFEGDAATEVIEHAATSVNLENQLAQLRSWAEASAERKAEWKQGPFSVDSWMHLDDAELAEFSVELIALIQRWSNREVPDDGRERSPVFVFAHAVPGMP